MALPSEAPEIRSNNNLADYLGKIAVIETQDVSDGLPKLQARRIARLCAVSYDTAATIAQLAFAVAR